jgi:hypothetical protein
MSDRRYILNRKCFAALRAMGKDKWEYLYCSPKGVICTDTTSLIRVTLPKFPVDVNPPEAVIFSAKTAKERESQVQDGKSTSVEMPAGEEAKSGKYSVPNLEAGITGPDKQTASITINARSLINLLEAACEVTEHSRSLVKLRFCGNSLRIDSHRLEGEQEFTGILMGIQYLGDKIPGEPTGKTINQPTETIDERKLSLPETQGRKFR